MLASSATFDLPRALKALRALFRDPDDLPQVFTVLESLSGRTLERMEARLRKTDAGRHILGDHPDIVPTLSDRDALRRLPDGSLGRAYLAFVESENISPQGILSADAAGRVGKVEFTETQIYLHQRMRDTHDLWHTVTGYKGDVLGEAALLGFTFAQSWNVGIGLIVGIGLAKTSGSPEARRLIVDGYRRGKAAKWFPAVAWEKLLERPLDDVRADLGVGAPPVYTPVRSSELKMAAAA